MCHSKVITRPRCSLLCLDCASSLFVVTAAAIFQNLYGIIGWLTNCLLPWLTRTPTAPYCICRSRKVRTYSSIAHRQWVPNTDDGANHGNSKRLFLSSFCEGISKKTNFISFVYVGASSMVATQQSCKSRNEPQIHPLKESLTLGARSHAAPDRTGESDSVSRRTCHLRQECNINVSTRGVVDMFTDRLMAERTDRANRLRVSKLDNWTHVRQRDA